MSLLTYPKILFKSSHQPKQSDLSCLTKTIGQYRFNRKKVAQYHQICGFGLINQVAPTYLCIEIQALQMSLMLDSRFPFKIIGLVHIANEITQYRPIAPNESVRLTCTFDKIETHDKGKSFNVLGSAHVGGELVWECNSTYLARGSSPTGLGGSKKEEPKPVVMPTALPTASEHLVVQEWRVPKDIGRRYAKVSGDFNPIHMSDISARMFGFKKAIAHGLWTKARALASLPKLPYAFKTQVQFKLPAFIPASVRFTAPLDDNAFATSFRLDDKDGVKPHLVGTMQIL
jgi:acyl dehydratase